MSEIQHGTLSTYTNKSCRCQLCRDANAAYNRAAKARRRAAFQAGGSVNHGKVNSYVSGCRCDLCKQANSMRRYSYNKAAQNFDYDAMYLAQDGKCALCGKPQPRLAVDHDHEVHKVRGLLCIGCNTGLGKLGDNIAGLLRALDYLEQAKE